MKSNLKIPASKKEKLRSFVIKEIKRIKTKEKVKGTVKKAVETVKGLLKKKDKKLVYRDDDTGGKYK